MKEKTNQINLYRLFNAGLFLTLDLKESGYRLEYHDDATRLFLNVNKESTPHWANYLKDFRSVDQNSLKNRRCEFVLLKLNNDKAYAITGGYGYTEIKDYIDPDFGQQIALRLIDENEITTLSQRSMKGTTRQIFRAVSGYDPLFDRENYNRILNSIEGKGKFEGRTFTIKGRSSIVLRTLKSVLDLDDVLNEIEEIEQQEEKIHLPKSYEQVGDESTVALLEQSLLHDFCEFWKGNSNRDNLYLEFPDPIIQFRCSKFVVKHGRKRIEIEDFDLDLIRRMFVEQGIGEVSSFDEIEKFRVTGLNEGGHEEFRDYSFSKLLVYECLVGNRHYVLMAERWLGILDAIQKHIDSSLKNVSVLRDDGTYFPWDRNVYPEELDYNKALAEKLGLYCLDGDLVQFERTSKIELCDIFDSADNEGFERNPVFYFIKETWGSKSSYLFSQAVVSASYFRNSSDFWTACRSKWPSLFRSEIKKAKIVIGIAHKKTQDESFPLNLSYFAKLSLHLAIYELRSLDFDVELLAIRRDS